MTLGTIAATSPRASAILEATRYVGLADCWGRHVWIENNGARRTLRHRGTDPFITFTWGRVGPGARELARAILWDAAADPVLAECFSPELARDLIARLPQVGFELGRDEVLAWLAARQRATGGHQHGAESGGARR
jgi:hypothetical protein